MAAIKYLKIAIIALILLCVVLIIIKYYVVYDYSVLFIRNQTLPNLPSKNVKNILSEKETTFMRNPSSANSVKERTTTTKSRIETLLLSKLSQKPPASITKLAQSKELITKLAVSASSKSNCKFWKYPYQVEFNGSSFFTLDPERFLYPALIWGPNNQIKGLQQAVYLAIKLNR